MRDVGSANHLILCVALTLETFVNTQHEDTIQYTGKLIKLRYNVLEISYWYAACGRFFRVIIEQIFS